MIHLQVLGRVVSTFLRYAGYTLAFIVGAACIAVVILGG